MSASPFTVSQLTALPPSLLARPELGPLLYAVFADAGKKDLLPGDGAAARREYYAALARTSILLARATTILDALRDAGIAALPLKGAVFAPTFYDNGGARPMSDLDLAVRPRDLDAASEVMSRLGYAPAFAGQERFSPRHAHDIAFHGQGVQVELHYRLFHELAVDASLDGIFDRAIEIDLLGANRRVPAWSDHLFITAVHAATHALSESPLWIFDVALLVRRAGGLDAAAAEASRRRAGYAFYAAIAIAHAALPDLVPAPVRPSGGALRDRLLDRVLGTDRMATRPSQLRSLLARAILTERPRDAAREIKRKLGLRAREAFSTRSE